MSQTFHRSTNFIARATIFGAVFVIGGLLFVMDGLSRSDYNTNAFYTRQQPVQFSHRHHVGDEGIDCRYCHTSVEESAFAGIPPTKTCMNCHSQIFADSPYLEPVRESWRTDKPIEWVRVHDLPDFVYFNHSIHVAKGVGCSSCHGRVDTMSLTYQVASLQMEWCLDCHRQPELWLRPKEEIYNMEYTQPANQLELGRKLKEEYKVRDSMHLTSCNTCHR